MRDPVENISKLQKQLNDLQLENQILKNILDQAGVSYKQLIARLKAVDEIENYDPEQGKRIIHPDEITNEMANNFFARFWGRQDVYAKRNENKDTGKAGYYNCREGVRAQLERMKELCKERNSLYEKQNDLKGQKYRMEKSLER